MFACQLLKLTTSDYRGILNMFTLCILLCIMICDILAVNTTVRATP
jgi:hypothetical protein